MYKSRKQKGVTMVALVITIIIMLILASIVINFAIGDKGIITRAKEAIELYKKAEEDEKVQLNNLYTQLASANGNEGISVGEITSIVDQIVDNKLLSKYPIGSIYMSMDEVNPSEFIGGTWEQVKDTFLLGAGDTYEAGTTGGEATHILTVNEMPKHAHTDNNGTLAGAYVEPTHGVQTIRGLNDNSKWLTGYTGGSQAHNNMPPYLTVYMWKRTA